MTYLECLPINGNPPIIYYSLNQVSVSGEYTPQILLGELSLTMSIVIW